jgi:integrator complex subunit 9
VHELGGSQLGNIHTALLSAVDPATIDCIVITNYHNMLALPYVTESAAGFRGVVLATEPTAEFGKLCMLELAEFIAASAFGTVPTAEGEWATSEGGLQLGPGRQPYTRVQVLACMEKVTRLNYMQSSSIGNGYNLTPWASGASGSLLCPTSPRYHGVLHGVP